MPHARSGAATHGTGDRHVWLVAVTRRQNGFCLVCTVLLGKHATSPLSSHVQHAAPSTGSALGREPTAAYCAPKTTSAAAALTYDSRSATLSGCRM